MPHAPEGGSMPELAAPEGESMPAQATRQATMQATAQETARATAEATRQTTRQATRQATAQVIAQATRPATRVLAGTPEADTVAEADTVVTQDIGGGAPSGVHRSQSNRGNHELSSGVDHAMLAVLLAHPQAHAEGHDGLSVVGNASTRAVGNVGLKVAGEGRLGSKVVPDIGVAGCLDSNPGVGGVGGVGEERSTRSDSTAGGVLHASDRFDSDDEGEYVTMRSALPPWNLVLSNLAVLTQVVTQPRPHASPVTQPRPFPDTQMFLVHELACTE